MNPVYGKYYKLKLENVIVEGMCIGGKEYDGGVAGYYFLLDPDKPAQFFYVHEILKEADQQKSSWTEVIVKGNRVLDQIEDLRNELKHIKKPYTVLEIIDEYSSGSCNAELLLQHALLHLIK